MEKQSLKDYAVEKNMNYSKAYREYKKGKIEGAFIEKGDIYVKKASVAMVKSNFKGTSPVSIAASANYRSNRSATAKPDDNLPNIKSLFTPVFTYSAGTSELYNNSCISATEMIGLVMRAYFGLGPVRNIINTLKEFSSSKIYLTGGNAKSRQFFENYFKTIKLQSFTDKFFLEFWRSSNCFIYKIYGKLKQEDINRWNKIYSTKSKSESAIRIPLQYVILNPADIIFDGSAFFSLGKYKKVLNSYEIARLQNPKTPEDIQILAALPPATQKAIKNSKYGKSIYLELPEDYVTCVFNNKQDYESFGVSLIYPVLDDLEHKLELKQMDRAIAKTCQQSVLHIALGYENKNGEYFFSEEAKEKIEEIFKGEEIGRVLITDFTAKINFILPQIGDLLDPKKYTIVDQDIKEGLMDIMFGGGGGGEKFSNLSVKVKVFVEKIRKARQEFLNEFLIPEMLLIAEEMGFKSIPEPKFEDIDIEDNINFYKIVAELAKIGLITPEELFEAFDNGRLPTGEESIESQTKYKELRDKGLYTPLIGAPKEGETAPEGRPPGTTGIPQATKSIVPQGTSTALNQIKINYDKFTDALAKELEFKEELKEAFQKSTKTKILTLDQINLVNSLANEIIIREDRKNWKTVTNDYLQNKINNSEQYEKVKEISKQYSISLNTAATIYHSDAKK